MRRAAALSLLAWTALAAGCSKQAEANYRHCLKLRVGMTKDEMVNVMGAVEETIPYVEGKSLPYLKGRTAFEWSNPASMPGGDHVSLDDASGKIESIRCSNSEITASVFVEPPAPSSAAAPAPLAAPAPAASASKEPPAGIDDAVAAYRKKDFPRALKIVNPLAGAENADAQLLLGQIFLHAKDLGMKDESAEAMRWIYKSGRNGNCEASALYAASITGRSSAPNVASETASAAAQGCPFAEFLQGTLLLTGLEDVVPADADAGTTLLVASAQAGFPPAQFALAKRYQTVAKDPVEAYRWTLLAARHPVADAFADPLRPSTNAWKAEDKAEADALLKTLKTAMTPAQLADATARAAK
jgi:hypothetical protein